MKKSRQPSSPNDEIEPEYDFRGGVRSKYVGRYLEASKVVTLDPDVAAEFKDSEAVNAALRALLKGRSKP